MTSTPQTETPKKFTLRPYQKEAIEAVQSARALGMKRMLVCLPTGAGKTVIFSHLASIEPHDILVLAHREELLTQAQEKLQRALGNDVIVDIEQANQTARPEAKVVVCSIRSLRTDRLMRVIRGRRIGLVIYDECHHAAAEDNQRVLREIGVFMPKWRGALVGFTATTQRGDGIGLEVVFQDIVYSRSILDMIRDEYLSPLRGYRISTSADLRSVATTSSGDFKLDELAEAVDIEERNALVARSIQELARDRRTIAFCVTVNHARNLARAMRYLGVPAGIIHGNMKREERAETLAQFRSGELQVITNVGVLTEGFDDPGVSCIAMARPTRSPGLYAQCVGRGTRLHPGKKDCLVLDFVDLSKLSLTTLPSLFGMPRDLNLFGEDVAEAREKLFELSLEYPQFEMEAGEISLQDITELAQGFDPLTMSLDNSVRAISQNAWVSLGSAGVLLHFHTKRNKLSKMVVLDSGQRAGKRYHVYRDDEPVAQFSTLEEAVQAVDYEVERYGPLASSSARPNADWRSRPTPDHLQHKLRNLRPQRHAHTIGQALHYLAYATFARKRKLSLSPKHLRRQKL